MKIIMIKGTHTQTYFMDETQNDAQNNFTVRFGHVNINFYQRRSCLFMHEPFIFTTSEKYDENIGVYVDIYTEIKKLRH